MCRRMLLEFEKKIADYVKANKLVGPAQRLLLAVSGGADSTALLHVMHALKAAGSLNCELLCAHVNHQLRGRDADLDEALVADQAAELKISLTTGRLDVREYSRREKLSIETAARQLRIQTLSRIAKENNCDAVVTAHQKNDNAETVIQRMARGTGFRGLAGIWPVRIFADGTKFIRPLLCAGRDEIIAYLQERNLQWCCDRTNTDCGYRRNFIRHKLLPELQRNANRSIVEQLSELAGSAHRFCRLISSHADDLWPEMVDCDGDKVTIDVGMFLSRPRPVKVEIVRRSLAQIGCGERYLTQKHYEKILQLAERNVTGKKFELPGEFIVYREYGKLTLSHNRECSVGQAPHYFDKSVTLKVPGRTRFGRYLIEAMLLEADGAGLGQFVAGKTNWVERFDLETIELPLTVRFRRAGDRFTPLGLKSQKKLGKFLTDQRIPRRLREKVLVIADAERIVWVCPVRMSEQAKVTNQTYRTLQLRITTFQERQNSVDVKELSK